MDDLVRFVQDGTQPSSSRAGLALLETALDVPGSIALPPQLAARIAESIRTRRAQAVAMVCISVDDHPERTRRALPSDSSHVGFLDAFSDCSGWLDRQAVAVAGCPSCSATLRDGGIDRLERALAEHPHVVAASRGSSVSRSMVLFVNSVSILASLPQSSFTSAPLLPRSTLALSHGISSVQHLLHRLVRAPHVSTVVAVCHPDLHDPAELDHLRASAHCVASVSPATALQADFVRAEHGLTPRGVLRTVAQRARRWGQVAARASSQLFAVTSSGVRMFPMPPEDVDAKKLARAVLQDMGMGSRERGDAEGDVVGGLSKLSGMSLELTPEQQEAKSQVELPFEHMGRSARYATTDFESYLPPAAGGRGAGRALEGAGKLGHILYVRDTDSEHDSDEDPDDDLDI